MRNYNELKYSSKEREEYYTKMNESENKIKGDLGEKIAKEILERLGYTAYLSSAQEDATQHIDLHAYKILNIDVKYKKDFWLELTNQWGNAGWVYTGADYIIQLFTPDIGKLGIL